MKCDKCEGVGRYPVRTDDNSMKKDDDHYPNRLTYGFSQKITAKVCEKCNGTGEV